MNHSIPDGLAVAIRTGAGLVLQHRRLQDGPVPARRPDHRPARLRPARARRASTSSWWTPRTPRSPASPRPSGSSPRRSTRCSRTAPRRIIVSSFASHVHRIQQVLDAAHTHGRKVAFVGRSMVRNMGIARDLGYLHDPARAWSSTSRSSSELPDDKVTLICTGSQGEPMAALSRMANGDHAIVVDEGDTVLLASSLIPGNENAIYGDHQQAHRPRRQRRAQGQRQGARLGPRQRRRARLLLQHRQAAQRPADPRRVQAPARQRRARRDAPACRPTASSSRGTGTPSTWSTAGSPISGQVPGRDGLRRRADRRPRHRGHPQGAPACSTRAASSRCSRCVDPDTTTLTEPLEFLTRGFVHDDHTFDDAAGEVDKALVRAAGGRITDIERLEDVDRRHGEPPHPAQVPPRARRHRHRRGRVTGPHDGFRASGAPHVGSRRPSRAAGTSTPP